MGASDLLFTHLGTFGLSLGFLGAVLMVGHRYYLSRRFGIWLSPTHQKRMNAFQALLEDNHIEGDIRGFEEFRELIFPTKFVEDQKMIDEYGLDFTYLEYDESKVIAHANETNTESNIDSDIVVRRDIIGVQDSMERAFEKIFLNYGVGLLALGFVLQFLSNILSSLTTPPF